jgi:hypothetical protein
VKVEPCYLKAIVIVHGKSEKQICDYIKSNLRLKMEVIAKKKGENSIQITSLKRILNDSRFKSFGDFIKKYDDVEVITIKRKKKISLEFKIFIIMDTDDCSVKEKEEYINKKMFKGHWAYDYITPIYNQPVLEDVLVKAKIPFEKKGNDRKKEYIKIFPTSKNYTIREEVELNTFYEQLNSIQETNMDEFIDFCLKKASMGIEA